MVRFARSEDLSIVTDRNYIPTDRMRSLIAFQQVLIAEDEGMKLGYACFDYFGAIHPFLALIRVFPEHRRQGVGRAILGFLENHLRSLGHDVLYSSSQVDEPEPQAWHRRVGFVECGFIAGFNSGGIGEILFRKNLESSRGQKGANPTQTE
ncbi:MAG TPA: GNAT family N-acetyltransferase [Chloroflexota bacterium]|nr:GNAT family N-acetyltransferase [Chloroflexota bacterium]